MLKLLVIKTKKECYITDNINVTANSYNKNYINYLFFDDKLPKQSFHEEWFIINKIPIKIQKEKKSEKINKRFELIDKKLESDKYPLILFVDYFTPENVWMNKEKSIVFSKTDFEQINPLYQFKEDKLPKRKEDVEFEIVNVLKFDEVKNLNGFSYLVQKNKL